jgi:hypothetical protein
VKCIETSPPVYLVKDDHGEILEGTFYAEEIQKVIKQDDVYKIQSVLKKRRKGRRVQYLVKWLGYPESFNSWKYTGGLVSIHFTTVNNSSVQLGKYLFLNVRLALLSRTLSLGENLHDVIFKSGLRPIRLQTDKGTEFTNRVFQKYLKEHDVLCWVALYLWEKICTIFWVPFFHIASWTPLFG